MENLNSDSVDLAFEDPFEPGQIQLLTVSAFSTISDFVKDTLPPGFSVSEIEILAKEELKRLSSSDFSLSFNEITNSKNLKVKVETYQLESFTMAMVNTSSDKKEVGKVITKGSKYRGVIPGINLEFKCSSDSCEAKGNYVVCKIGIKAFNPMEEYADCKCPVCGEVESLEKVIFYRCQYQTRGRYKEDKKSPPVVLKPESWAIAKENDFHRFSPDEAGTKQWIEIVIEAKELDK